jgi:ubiquinone/menaquinone biosynthesis C-methylase UbiE
MRHGSLVPYRRHIIRSARGRVLEIGIGSGLNLPFYPAGVSVLFGLDLSARLLRMAHGRAMRAGARTHLLQGSATESPVADASVDTVVVTWTLCSVPDPRAALAEVRRVLAPGGTLLFAEHGLAVRPGVQRWQQKLTPLWRNLAGGCNLDRKVDDLIRESGFELSDLWTGHAPGPSPLTYMYAGRARPIPGPARARRGVGCWFADSRPS